MDGNFGYSCSPFPQVQRLSVGSIPRSMVVALEDDLVDSCKSGNPSFLLFCSTRAEQQSTVTAVWIFSSCWNFQ